MKIPYNPNWGNEVYKISTYFNYENRLEFGPLVVHPPYCPWYRKYAMFFIPPLPAEEVIVSLKKEALKREPGGMVDEDSIIKDRINDYTIVRYTVFYEFAPPDDAIVVIGKKYNYHFIPCDLLCENIIKTTQFIE